MTTAQQLYGRGHFDGHTKGLAEGFALGRESFAHDLLVARAQSAANFRAGILDMSVRIGVDLAVVIGPSLYRGAREWAAAKRDAASAA